MNATEHARTRSARRYRSPFSVFGGFGWCPHCGSHFERERLAVVGEVTRKGGDGARPAVVCPVCHAHGFLVVGQAHGGET